MYQKIGNLVDFSDSQLVCASSCLYFLTIYYSRSNFLTWYYTVEPIDIKTDYSAEGWMKKFYVHASLNNA